VPSDAARYGHSRPGVCRPAGTGAGSAGVAGSGSAVVANTDTPPPVRIRAAASSHPGSAWQPAGRWSRAGGSWLILLESVTTEQEAGRVVFQAAGDRTQGGQAAAQFRGGRLELSQTLHAAGKRVAVVHQQQIGRAHV